MWILLIVIIVIIGIVMYANDKSNLNNKVADQGGMALKYSTLISHLLVDSNARITSVKPDFIETTWLYGDLWIKHSIKQGFSGLINVEWNTNMPISKKNLFWQFPDAMNQDEMFRTMTNDINTILPKM